MITTQTTELEALEARIREMDERLRHRRQNTNVVPANLVLLPKTDGTEATPTSGNGTEFEALDAKRKQLQQQQQQLANQQQQSQTSKRAEMPPTPSASEGELTKS